MILVMYASDEQDETTSAMYASNSAIYANNGVMYANNRNHNKDSEVDSDKQQPLLTTRQR